jgi:endonuclease I
MKKIYLFLLFITTLGFAQETNKSTLNVTAIPVGYYNTATGSGFTLKTQLKTIITSGHIDRGYGSGTSTSNNGLWTAYGTTDRDNGIGFENDNTIVDMYSENPTGVDPYNFNYNTTSGPNTGQCGTYTIEGDCYNREHLVPQAYFDHFATNPMKNDPHHVIPTDGKVNGLRDNFPFSKVNTASTTTGNGSKLGSNLNSGYSAGYVGTVFEPVDAFKGDIARCILYFATRYEDSMDDFYAGASSSLGSKAMFDGSIDNVFSPTFLNVLLTWHIQDPVSTKELLRNDAIYTFQGNRNPYVDHPEYVCQIWSAACAALSTNSFELIADINIYPNPSNDQRINIETENELDEIQLININGQIMQQISNPVKKQNKYALENLPHGFYFLKLSSDNKSIVKKIVIN